jgi:hypothetical protein
MDWFVAFFMVVPAGYLLLKRSPALVDYLIWVTVLNRGVRRYVDWLAGEFNPLSPISLTPLVVAACVFLLVMQNYSRLPAHFRKIMGLFGIALGLAFTVGLVRNQLAAVYALAEYVAPLSVMACAVMAGGNERVLDRWIRTVGWAADFFIFPSHYEAFSLATLEAAASGLPILTTRINGTEELVRPGVNGEFVSKSPDDIAMKVDALLAGHGCLKAMGEAARRIVMEEYTWDRVTELTEAAYRKSLARRERR